MKLKSNFDTDLQKEQQLSVLLDGIYQKKLTQYSFKRIHDLKKQYKGIDLVFTHKTTQKEYYIDEKAQLDYLNDDLPTFAFELSYQKKQATRQGWLFDVSKKTDFYALITAIYTDEPHIFTSCKITFVNRHKLITFLQIRNLDEKNLKKQLERTHCRHGKMELNGLDPKKEGYLYFSTLNKAEKPVNLILKLGFLIENGLAKRLT